MINYLKKLKMMKLKFSILKCKEIITDTLLNMLKEILKNKFLMMLLNPTKKLPKLLKVFQFLILLVSVQHSISLSFIMKSLMIIKKPLRLLKLLLKKLTKNSQILMKMQMKTEILSLFTIFLKKILICGSVKKKENNKYTI